MLASRLIPLLLVAAFGWFLQPSWWAMAMVCGGALFAWDWLWGDRRLLQPAYGLQVAAFGIACLAAGAALAWNLGLSMAEFQAITSDLPRRSRLLYQLPGIGIGTTIYGLLVWSRAREHE